MALTTEETRWLATLREPNQPFRMFSGIFLLIVSAFSFYASYSEGMTHRLPDGTMVLTASGTVAFGTGLLMMASGMRALPPSVRDLADRPRRATTARAAASPGRSTKSVDISSLTMRWSSVT
jgi:hypothetical protein